MALSRITRLALVVACSAGSTVLAGQVVQLTDGRVMEAVSVSMGGQRAVITLEGGGEIAFPASRIARISEVETEAPASAAPLAGSDSEHWRAQAGPYADLIAEAAERYDLDPALLTAMASVESAFDPDAVSPKGAAGLMQLMPATAARFGVRDRFDVDQNVHAGAAYMSWLLRRFEGRTELALAGYNAGEGAVDRHRGIPPYRETRAYVSRVMSRAGRLGLAGLTR